MFALRYNYRYEYSSVEAAQFISVINLRLSNLRISGVTYFSYNISVVYRVYHIEMDETKGL